MSALYASRLSEYPNKGVVGLPEIYDTHRALTVKINRLVKEVREATHIVILTGAGISTSSGIPDFRGPNGFWTKEKLEKQQQQKKSTKSSTSLSPHTKRKRSATVISSSNSNSNSNNSSSLSEQKSTLNDSFTFADASPTLTHCAITKLIFDGKVKYCITQNVDGLHRRSGLSRNHHSAVHGCVFTEKCARSDCGCELFGDVEVDGLSFQKTGNKCEECVDGGDLRDTLLDWEDPILDMERVSIECQKADLMLCLGTSLRIEPVGSLPLMAKKFILVNLQATPLDDKAAFVVRARVDDVISRLMSAIGYKHNWYKELSPSIERKWKPTAVQNEDWAYMIETESLESNK